MHNPLDYKSEFYNFREDLTFSKVEVMLPSLDSIPAELEDMYSNGDLIFVSGSSFLMDSTILSMAFRCLSRLDGGPSRVTSLGCLVTGASVIGDEILVMVRLLLSLLLLSSPRVFKAGMSLA